MFINQNSKYPKKVVANKSKSKDFCVEDYANCGKVEEDCWDIKGLDKKQFLKCKGSTTYLEDSNPTLKGGDSSATFLDCCGPALRGRK